MMNIIAIIPARMGSSRFPGKPLADIFGLPMVAHVALRTALSDRLSGTYIATCDDEIMDVAASIGIEGIMTSKSHTRCSDRTAEALGVIESMTGKRADIVVMVQGDEPMVTPAMIDASVEPLIHDPALGVVNLMGDIHHVADFDNPNEVKVVTDLAGNALYFSREPIPSRRKGAKDVPMKKQVCVIPFRRDFLLRFNSLPETPLEIVESVDMMRVLENGDKVRMVHTSSPNLSVDTPEDLERVRKLMRDDPLLEAYMPPAGAKA